MVKIEVVNFEVELLNVPDWVNYELKDNIFLMYENFDIDDLAIEIGERLIIDCDKDNVEVLITNIEWEYVL